ncbi:imidazole glycerol phosphate synthase subunit HisH [Listeria costaricensis]|uniref:imidazole glycerol phosphate synthase subunit HisH n=1 Tax=Listeria costaricensis TaxID=2026604 RepID=UPI000C07347D|nr:imidazole glycerol phosphate synthase subunit HisH [Listeria costaricensis]
MIAIIDYDTGNTRSIQKALTYIGLPSQITADPLKIQAADGLILPGVGAFKQAMQELKNRALVDLLKQEAASGKPILGVCLGMQLLLNQSEEHGLTSGLGLIPGNVKRIPPLHGQKIPHMGWNQLHIHQETPLTSGLEGKDVYFVHSYFADTAAEYTVASTTYGIQIPAIIRRGNVYGAQFHPEKSGTIGLQILAGFKEVITCKSTQQSI